MRTRIISAVLIAVMATCLIQRLHGAQSPASRSRSVWDGVYTEAQGRRGEPIYVRECSTCHGAALKGGEGSPALAGSDFTASWNGRTVGELFDNIRRTMPAPPEEPGKLSAQQTADVVAHILSVNGFPAGATELAGDLQKLKDIRIISARP
jgi:mono/diheme cytochrome c family protein